MKEDMEAKLAELMDYKMIVEDYSEKIEEEMEKNSFLTQALS